MRTPQQWREYAEKHITSGYVPGGDRSRVYEHGVKLRHRIETYGEIELRGKSIFDLGCANARLGMAIADYPDVRYFGVDVSMGAIRFCQHAFAQYENFSFYHANVYNGRYSSHQRLQPIRYTLPIEDEGIDVAIANSFFTHMSTTEIARHYVNECRRVLKTGGYFYTTWFRNPPHPISQDPAFTVYNEKDVLDLFCEGFLPHKSWGGTRKTRQDQWHLIYRKE